MLVLLLIGCLAQAEEAEPVIDESVTTTSETEEAVEETTEVTPAAPANPTATTTVTVIEDENASVEVTVDQNGETQINVSVTPDLNIQDESMKTWDDTMEMLELIKQSEAVKAAETSEETENESE